MHRSARIASWIIGTLLVGIAALETWERSTYDGSAWRADFAQLEAHVARTYANLDWAVMRWKLDLPQLHRETLAALESAQSSAVAKNAIQDFIAAFHDPHFRVEQDDASLHARLVRWFRSSSNDGPRVPPRPTDAALDALGYQDGRTGFRIDFGAGARFERLPVVSPAPFQAGVLTLANGKRVGVVRIADFRPQRYRATAALLWPKFRDSRTGPWRPDDESAFQDEVANALLDRLAARVDELRAKSVDAILVDVTRNGGGTSWANAAARVFTAKPLAPPRVAFIRHPHWVEQFEDAAKQTAALLARTDLRASTRALLEAERDRIAACLAEAKRPVDRDRVWTDATAPVEPLLYAGDAIREPLWPDDVEDELGTRVYRPRAGAWTGPLFVLVDGFSASATEAFAAMLQDNGAATIVGSKTMGAGQGYTNGGVPCELTRSGLTVAMPDSARLRKDGSPEIDGITPDVPIDWADDDAADTKGKKVVAALERASI